MKATGIVRRIDDLGRVVVPKEIRRTLRIREGDPLEIFTDQEGEIILKKYSPMKELGEFATRYAECMAQVLDCLVCVTDTDRVIAAAGPGKKEYQGKLLSEQMLSLMEQHVQEVVVDAAKDKFRVTVDDRGNYQRQIASAIISSGDAIGAIVLCGEAKQLNRESECVKLVKIAAEFLGSQMEN